ncbi:hypothetical protein EBS02_05850 [bacterium]|nr:hypothetical protein [bacterium]
MKTFFLLREERSCPVATIDINVNVKNRQHAIEEYTYGPANPDEPGDYWDKLAEIWGIDADNAKTMKCGNCAAFDISDKMRDCIEKGIHGDEKNIDAMATINKADLGYCNILHFKCAGTRSCSLWLTNGPLDDRDLT